MPYKNIKIRYSDFKLHFVEQADPPSSRPIIFERYEKYLEAFKKKVSPRFVQWINGSFVTKKKNPDDIDFVTFLDYKVYEEKELVVKDEFVRKSVLNSYGIDAYLVVIYPENHKLYSCTKSDTLYWYEWFSRTKMNKQRKRHHKGFVEITFNP